MLARVPLVSLFVTWLSLLAFPSSAAPNYVAHCYEKLFLWEVYSIIVRAEGPKNNKDIFPFLMKAGQVEFDNRGSSDIGEWGEQKVGKKGKKMINNHALTYTEFMERCKDNPLDKGPDNKPNPLPIELHEPGVNDVTLDQAAEELHKHMFGAPLPAKNMNPKLRSVSKDTYDILIQGLERKLSDMRIQGKYSNIIEPRMQRMKTATQRILVVRREDTQDYKFSVLAKDTKNGGLGLGNENVIHQKRKSALSFGREYNDVDLSATFEKNKEQLKSHFKDRNALADWMDHLGDAKHQEKAGGPAYEAASKGHLKTMNLWKTVDLHLSLEGQALKNACI